MEEYIRKDSLNFPYSVIFYKYYHNKNINTNNKLIYGQSLMIP
jgi:hypothetical protein